MKLIFSLINQKQRNLLPKIIFIQFTVSELLSLTTFYFCRKGKSFSDRIMAKFNNILLERMKNKLKNISLKVRSLQLATYWTVDCIIQDLSNNIGDQLVQKQ